MKSDFVTIGEWSSDREKGGTPLAGVVLLFSGGKPLLSATGVHQGSLLVGRTEAGPLALKDERVSRQHVLLEMDGAHWWVTDLGSRNGTFVAGARIHGRTKVKDASLVRIGGTLLWLSNDIRKFDGWTTPLCDEQVIGPTFRSALQQVSAAAVQGNCLHLSGESGSGKEVAARFFHRAGAHASGPFVPVNCAAIPPALAEALLFGAKKGAYSGAVNDAVGYLQAADGGVLFLDEVAELSAEVQAKLLRVVESQEVVPLGGSKAQRVDAWICSATHVDLRTAAAEGSFRSDLFFRIGRPQVRLPALRDRPEEVAWHLATEIAQISSALSIHCSLVETCLLRPWPGNIRELRVEARCAAQAAQAAGADCVEGKHLDPRAGTALQSTASASEARPVPSEEEVELSLRECDGNLSAAARRLGIHRTQLYRLLRQLKINS